MVLTLYRAMKIIHRLHSYEPQGVTPVTLWRWLRQFNKEDRAAALVLLDRVVYIGKREVVASLLEQNTALQKHLAREGIRPSDTIYVHIDDPGSSSSIMINLLRNKANLERLSCFFVDSKDQGRIIRLLSEKKDAAVVYVDDFLGTGKQFCRARNFIASFFPTARPEFLIAPCVCEEAITRLAKLDVEVYTSRIHLRVERPLHPNSHILTNSERERLLSISTSIGKNASGWGGLAASVAMFHNSPNNMPLVLRGNLDQKPFVGILPRYKDLPVPSENES